MEEKSDRLSTGAEVIDTLTKHNVSKNEDGILKQKQKARSFLRQRFFKILSHLTGRSCDLSMYENTHVEGTFCGSDNSFTHLNIKNLETPYGVLPSAIVRSSDLICMKILINKTNNVPFKSSKS